MAEVYFAPFASAQEKINKPGAYKTERSGRARKKIICYSAYNFYGR